MKEIIVRKNEAGQRLDKFLRKYLKEAPGSFLYKMLRKKNITLNGKKASGAEKLAKGDAVRLFLSDETIQRFSSEERIETAPENLSSDLTPDIIYEDTNILLLNKPVGMLSQKAQKTDRTTEGLADVCVAVQFQVCSLHSISRQSMFSDFLFTNTVNTS